MLTLSLVLTLCGFYCCYATSRRAVFIREYRWEYWLGQHTQISNTLGVVLMLLGALCCVYDLGVTSGIFSYLILCMTVVSLVFLLRPLQFLSLPGLLMLLVLSLLVELLLT